MLGMWVRTGKSEECGHLASHWSIFGDECDWLSGENSERYYKIRSRTAGTKAWKPEPLAGRSAVPRYIFIVRVCQE